MIERININLINQVESIKYQEELEEISRDNVDLKIQLEEAKRMKYVLKNQLDEREKTCEHI